MYFVTSEQYRSHRPDWPDGPRRYTARYITAGGEVETIGEFQAHETQAAAVAAMNAAIAAHEKEHR